MRSWNLQRKDDGIDVRFEIVEALGGKPREEQCVSSLAANPREIFDHFAAILRIIRSRSEADPFSE
jgi:hypothetical protein